MTTRTAQATPDQPNPPKPRPRLSANVLGFLATPALKEALDAVRAKGGTVPPMLGRLS